MIGGFVSRFFGWFLIAMVGAITYFAISIPLFSSKLFRAPLGSLIDIGMVIILVAMLVFSWWRAHRSFFVHVPKNGRKTWMIGAYILSVILCVGGLFGMGKGLYYFIDKEFFGIVSWHRPKMKFFPPLGYGGPPIPRTARNIHLEQWGWLDPYLLLRFEDRPDRLETFAASLKLPLREGIHLPELGTWSVLGVGAKDDPKFSPFADVCLVRHGRSFLDESHRECLVIDDETHRLYWFIW